MASKKPTKKLKKAKALQHTKPLRKSGGGNAGSTGSGGAPSGSIFLRF